MNLYDTTFLLAFLIALGVLGLKFYSILRLATDGPLYKFPGAILSFVGYFVAWIVCLVVLLQEPSELLFTQLLQLLSWLVIVNFMLFAVELFLLIQDSATQPIKAYMGQEAGPKAYAPLKR